MKQPSYIEDFEKWKEEFSFFHSASVRFSDLDMFGHLNNAKVFVYFEDARLQFFTAAGYMANWMNHSADEIIVTADLQADYLKQVYFDQTLRIGVKVNRIGTSSLDLHYVVLSDQNEVCITGRGTIVQIDSKSGLAQAISEEQRQRLFEISAAS